MKEPIKETLYRVAIEVLEKIAFVFSSREDERENLGPDSAVTVKVDFSGLFNGVVVMALSKGILPEITGNMLGIDDSEETSVEQQHDAIKELINVICGNLLPAVAGKNMVFNVDTPEIVAGGQAAEDGEPIAAARLALEEEGRCDLFLHIRGPMPGIENR